MTTIDFKDAYFTIPMHKDQYKYLRFEWKSKLFEFTCLPFGLSSAPRVFTKVMKPVVAGLRGKGIRLVIYLDDIAIISSSYDKSLQDVKAVVELLESLGFIVNREKSSLISSQEIVYLGFVIDSVRMTVSLPQNKLNRLMTQSSLLREKTCCTIRDLAHVIGLIVSSFPAIRPAKLYYRELEALKQKALFENGDNYGAVVSLSDAIKDELEWFVSKCANFNGSCFRKPMASISVVTDASLSGWGVVCGDLTTSGAWSTEEQAHHINWLELMAIWFGVQCFVEPQHSYVKVFCDNSTAVSYVNNLGGRSTELHRIARSIWEWCLDHHITVEAFHLPGKLNTHADSLSRELNPNTEWMLNPDIFLRITGVFFVPDIDLFASRLNCQISTYASWKPDPGAKAIDAFSLDWHNLSPYMFPPFSLLGKSLAKLKREKVSDAIIVAPWWSTAHWYPMLVQLAVSQPLLLPRSRFLLIQPRDKFQTHPLIQSLRLAAWHVSGVDCRAKEFLKKQLIMSSNHGAQAQKSNIQQPGNAFVAGVKEGVQIHFKLL